MIRNAVRHMDKRTILWVEQIRDRGISINEGPHIHIFGFAQRENNQFQKKLMRQNPNI